MPEAKGKGPEHDDFVSKVAKDPNKPADAALVSGFVGKSSEEGHTRIHFDPELKHYIDVPNDAILHSEKIPAEHSSLGGSHVWIKRDAEILHGPAGAPKTKSKFFEGPIAAGAAGLGGPANLPFTPLPIHCAPSPPPLLCPVTHYPGCGISHLHPCITQYHPACPTPLCHTPVCTQALPVCPTVVEVCASPGLPNCPIQPAAQAAFAHPITVGICPTPTAVLHCVTPYCPPTPPLHICPTVIAHVCGPTPSFECAPTVQPGCHISPLPVQCQGAAQLHVERQISPAPYCPPPTPGCYTQFGLQCPTSPLACHTAVCTQALPFCVPVHPVAQLALSPVPHCPVPTPPQTAVLPCPTHFGLECPTAAPAMCVSPVPHCPQPTATCPVTPVVPCPTHLGLQCPTAAPAMCVSPVPQCPPTPPHICPTPTVLNQCHTQAGCPPSPPPLLCPQTPLHGCPPPTVLPACHTPLHGCPTPPVLCPPPTSTGCHTPLHGCPTPPAICPTPACPTPLCPSVHIPCVTSPLCPPATPGCPINPGPEQANPPAGTAPAAGSAPAAKTSGSTAKGGGD